jgi:hypothetical protein
MVNPLDTLLKWAFDNIFYLCGIGLVAYFIHEYFTLKRVEKTKPVDRSEVERKNIIERLKLNPSKKYKWLYKGEKCLGKIQTIIGSTVKGNPEDLEVFTITFKPLLLSNPVKIVNPIAKTKPIVVDNATVIMTKDEYNNVIETDKIVIKESVAVTQYQGIFYTVGKNEELIKDNIRNFDTFKTDINNLASIYFVKSQEQSTYQPQYAHELALKEKEIQLMMAQKKGKMETI